MNLDLDNEWNDFLIYLKQDNNKTNKENKNIEETENNKIKENKENKYENLKCPKATEIHISTKSKIAYLSETIDLNLFWEIPIIHYGEAKNGVIKKQIKINTKNQIELDNIKEKLSKELYYEEQIITHIDNPNGRIIFKDIRKISIGISKKDIITYRSKKKQAFYNCFVLILRIKINEVFKEFHVKIFNTGKIEIPGLQNEEQYNIILENIILILQKYFKNRLYFRDYNETILINSNFNCGFYIKREILFDIIKNKYNIQAIYDPCSYPGIQCKFYYDINNKKQNGVSLLELNKTKKKIKKDKNKDIIEVSFMIFRTGSVLIVGMCNDNILYEIYEFLKKMFINEFPIICHKIIKDTKQLKKHKKIRKKILQIQK